VARKDIIMMSERELKRSHIIHKVLDKELKQVKAAEFLSLSDRQIRRIVKRVRKEGKTGVIHKSRGRSSNRAMPKRIKDRVIKLYREKYGDFGPTLATEKFFETHKIKMGIQTLRNWLIKDGAWQIRRKHRKHRQWRERKHYFGEMIQIDGSHHDWFEGRGPECALMGYIDDATNNVFARFYEYEGTIPLMDSFKRYVEPYGIPQSVYIDNHTTYKSPKKHSIEDELNNTEPLSQAGRALKELGVDVTHAYSPQAKGRVERLFRTLQDRLIKEMRLRGIKTIEEANEFLEYYLPIYNKRFRFEAIEDGDLHRDLPKGIDLDRILCIKTNRGLRNDWTVSHNKRLYQVIDHVHTKEVIVEEKIDGSMVITYKGTALEYKEISERPVRENRQEKKCIFKPKKIYRPPEGHPWRKFKIRPQISPYQQMEKVA
jgi:hypothetical protein